jgi:serine/threonine-protein kinase
MARWPSKTSDGAPEKLSGILQGQTMRKINTDDHPEAYEQELADLITSLADRINAGERVELEKTCLQHPTFESDLRDLWGTIVVTRAAADEMASKSFTDESDIRIPGLEVPYDLGSYVLEEEIGRGGMGIVYRATRKSDDRTIAIKMILKGDFASQGERERFKAEAEAAARLNHRNIAPIYEIGEHEGLAFFCMKLIDGGTLTERLMSGPLHPRTAGKIMAEICSAVDYAHSQGVLHRDLKPSNILLDHSDKAYIVDFGLAKQASSNTSLTKSGAILGTPSYMSPEQAAGARGEVGAVSDVYSLGAILYHMLTGRPPFLGASPVDTLLMVLEQDPLVPRALNRRVDRKLEMIAMRCLQKPQDLRYQSAKNLTKDVQAFLNNKSISAREGRLVQVIANLFRETHHAEILENWGLIWMWHSLVLLIASLSTHFLWMLGNENRVHYWLMWTFGLGAWAVVFWFVRRTMGPVTFVERQVAHVWASAMCCVAFLFPLEAALNLEVLSLAPLLAVVAGMVFLIKAGILSGSFYFQAAVMFSTSVAMAKYPSWAMVIFGFASGACFFVSGWKYYRKRSARLLL